VAAATVSTAMEDFLLRDDCRFGRAVSGIKGAT